MKCGANEWEDERVSFRVHGEEGHEPDEEIVATCASCDHVQVVV